MSKIAVIGAGASGMMAAVFAARKGHEVYIFEQNEKVGKKLFITGKGRCNVTNASDVDELLTNVISNPKFLFSAFHDFDSNACMAFFEQLGVRLKTERGNRVFPQSDHSSDIIKALEYEMRRLNITVRLNTSVEQLLVKERMDLNENDKKQQPAVCYGIKLSDGTEFKADNVLLASGGVSYPLTGSNGSGLEMAGKAGHKITPLYPALVPLRTKETWCHDLMGLSLRNVSLSVFQGKKILYDGFGEMLFTHYGISGPLVLSASSKITKKLANEELSLYLDLKPALTFEQLDKRVLRDFEAAHNKQFKNALNDLLPTRLIPVVIKLSGISPEKKINEISKKERTDFVLMLKKLPLTIKGTSDFKEAIITQGGISIKEVNPSTMESKKVKNLYLAGECLDVDALTGGFNLQIAWSTAYVAGNNIGEN